MKNFINGNLFVKILLKSKFFIFCYTKNFFKSKVNKSKFNENCKFFKKLYKKKK